MIIITLHGFKRRAVHFSFFYNTSMFSFFSRLLGQSDNSAILSAIQKGAFLVDVRSPQEFAGGSPQGAVNIPLDTVAKNLQQFRGKSTIIVFCQSGARSKMAQSILQQQGFDNVLNGGSWRQVYQLQASVSS